MLDMTFDQLNVHDLVFYIIFSSLDLFLLVVVVFFSFGFVTGSWDSGERSRVVFGATTYQTERETKNENEIFAFHRKQTPKASSIPRQRHKWTATNTSSPHTWRFSAYSGFRGAEMLWSSHQHKRCYLATHPRAAKQDMAIV
jgi:hypothetical protein